MTSIELYTKGTKVWIAHPENVWQCAELLDSYAPSKKTLQIKTDSNEVQQLSIKGEKDLPFLRNPQMLIGENDLTSLSYLHEPAVLYNLKVRFSQHKYIYTYCGIVLVAINPYHELNIYDVDTIQAYRGQPMGDLDPHIFAVAEDAYTQMEREQRDQCIIVSGESGAGKTVNAKYAMRYFATVGGNVTETHIEKKVLACSPIMEAIGNAKTTRNDNSSRFGKFIELQFSKLHNISGASMRTYLLEKSRVVFQASDERNYHVFYQLCAARKLHPHLHLEESSRFFYLNQGDSPHVDGVDDLAAFEETFQALQVLGFKDSDIANVFRIIAAILHLGNIQFGECIVRQKNEQDQEGCEIKSNDKHLGYIGELIGVDIQALDQWLCIKKIVSMRDVFMKPMSVEEAIRSRDALAKHIYSHLFAWIVVIINKALESDVPRHKFIGVLDIYGFEKFETNSFEQFCINYANEKLQQQFNMHVFKLEQDEYVREEIAWKMIDFYDNQPCIDLIEAKLGILDLLDEECRMPRGSDDTWTEKLYAKCAKYSHFGKARFGSSAFIINHFADKVQYESNGFLEKNRDTIIEQQINVIRNGSNELVSRLFGSENEMAGNKSGVKLKVISSKQMPATGKVQKKTVGSQFRDSLNMLMMTLNATTPHYVRCIKPNDGKSSFAFNEKRTVEQLRACGVLETIRISSAGFPSRWSYQDFFHRYRVLCTFKDINRNDMKVTCQNILKQHIRREDMYQFGKTKIFFRAGQVAFFEKIRSEKLRKCCIIMQSTVRAFIWRKKYLRITNAVYNLQRYARGFLARRLAEELRRNKAAVTIQRFVKGWLQRTQYQRKRALMVHLQRYSRGCLARRRFMAMKYNAKAIIIQRNVRGYLARREMLKRKRQIVLCQAVIRRFLARRKYKRLRIEARSIEHVKKLNKGLENKIFTLQHKIEDLNAFKTEAQHAQAEITELKTRMITFKAMEVEIKNLKSLLMKKNESIRGLEESVKLEQNEKMDIINEKERHQNEIDEERNRWNEETNKLRTEIDTMNEMLKTSERGTEEAIKRRLEEEKLLLQKQQDNDTVAYQKLLEEHNKLESICDSLHLQLQEMNRSSAENGRNLSFLSTCSDFPDNGYGSVKSTSSNNSHLKLENIDWKNEQANESQPSSSSSSDNTKFESNKVDIALVLNFQHKLTDVENERSRLAKRLDEIEMSPRAESAEKQLSDAIKISELELCNSTLKAQLKELHNSVQAGSGQTKMQAQMQELQAELDRKSDEIVQLRSILSNQTSNLKSLVSSKARTGEYINEDGELALAYETQKTINKQLELELQDEKEMYKVRVKEFKLEVEKLREDNERQRQLLSSNLETCPQSQNEVFMQLEITRIASENLKLVNTNDTFADKVRSLKKQLKVLQRKLKDCGIDPDETLNEHVIAQANKIATPKPTRNIPNIKKEKGFKGMFAFGDNMENEIMRVLVKDMKPRTALKLLPGLPAYIIFMCVRYTDFTDNESTVISLLSAFVNAVKRVLKSRRDDVEVKVLWLANILCLTNCMQQYSGDSMYNKDNTEKQNEQRLRNFDLSEYRRLIADLGVNTFHVICEQIKEQIQPMIVPAILEHEEIQQLAAGKPGFRKRTTSIPESPVDVIKPATLLQVLTEKHKLLTYYGVSSAVISQLFKQLYYFICASSLNNLLLRKELCHWAKGFQIRHNLSHFEMWTREKNMDGGSIQAALQPIVQAAQLLQARKQDDDVDSVCEMCSALTPTQICKLLSLYTPVDEFEQHVSTAFIRNVKSKLEAKGVPEDQQALLMDIKHYYAIRFPFAHSPICLEHIEIPEDIHLPFLEKL